ncbi:POK19 protein, partial [Odontophorus gujanensis]|nr:POK19 protein [Odontophorus gujanensis]
QQLCWIEIPKFQLSPISDGITVFTDAGKRSHTAAITWQEKGQWHHKILAGQSNDSLQTLELAAVVWVISNFLDPLNVVSDSLYVVGIVQRVEASLIKEVNNKRLHTLLI